MAGDKMVRQHHRLTDMNLSKLRESGQKPGMLYATMGLQRVGHDLATTTKVLTLDS